VHSKRLFCRSSRRGSRPRAIRDIGRGRDSRNRKRLSNFWGSDNVATPDRPPWRADRAKLLLAANHVGPAGSRFAFAWAWSCAILFYKPSLKVFWFRDKHKIMFRRDRAPQVQNFGLLSLTPSGAPRLLSRTRVNKIAGRNRKSPRKLPKHG
jgi:hypothetical protein